AAACLRRTGSSHSIARRDSSDSCRGLSRSNARSGGVADLGASVRGSAAGSATAHAGVAVGAGARAQGRCADPDLRAGDTATNAAAESVAPAGLTIDADRRVADRRAAAVVAVARRAVVARVGVLAVGSVVAVVVAAHDPVGSAADPDGALALHRVVARRRVRLCPARLPDPTPAQAPDA